MRGLRVFLVCAVLTGCAPKETPLPPTAPPPEDLSLWTVPTLVQPAPRSPLPTLPDPRKPTAAEQVLTYAPGETYKVVIPMESPLDVMLEPGEEIRDLVASEVDEARHCAASTPVPDNNGAAAVPAGARKCFITTKGKHSQGASMQHHLFLQATESGMTIGLIVTTTRRVYYLMGKSVKRAAIRVVRWTYPTEAPLAEAVPAESGLLPDPQQPVLYHVGYSLTSAHAQPPDWMPRYVADDGKKLYIVYPEVTLFGTVPLVRGIGPNGPQVLNARQFLNVVIIDSFAQVPRFELRVGTGEKAEVVTITRGALRTVECPDDPDCPRWPAAARTLARR